MFLQRFFILLVLWALSFITTNAIAAASFSSLPAAGSLIKFNSTESGESVSQTIRITNGGVDPLEITSAVFGLTNPSNFSFPATTTFPLSIPAGGSSSFVITCTPDLTSYLTYANLGLTTNDPLKLGVSYTLACTRNSTGVLYESYPPKNTDINSFGDVNIGSSKTRSGVIFNAGDTAMTISSLSFSGTDASSFSVALNPTSPLSGGLNTYFVINCSPTKVGILEANLVVNTNASNVTSITYGLTCNGVGNSSPTDIILDNQSVDGGSPADTFIGNLSTIDPDAADTHTYSISGISIFTIKNNQLFTSQTMPLVVNGGSYSVTIISTDNGGLITRKIFNINVIPKVGARFQSNPPPNQLINLGKTLVLTPTLGQTNTGQLEIIETGDMELNVSANITGTNATDFKVFPNVMVLGDGSSSQFFTIECTPSAKGIRSAQLQLSTNSASSPTTFTYPLQCEGLTGASFSSNPPPNQVMKFGRTLLNNMVSKSLQIIETGDMELQITPTLGGFHSIDFRIPLISIILPDGAPPKELIIECTPSELGLRTATLELLTNDPEMPTISYPLECESVDNTAHFSSVPPPNQTIQLGKTPINQAITHTLEITETGTNTLNITPTIKGANASDFKISPNSMTLPDGSPPQIFNIECKPQAEGIRIATLELVFNIATGGVVAPLLTNAPTLVSYPLECEGTPITMFNSDPLPNSLIFFNSDAQGTPVSQRIQITNRSNQNLSINSFEIQGGAYANSFSQFSVFPMNIAPQSSSSLSLLCKPETELLQGGFLHLTTNDPANQNVTYGLACLKRGTGAIYVSLPRVNETIYFNDVIIGRPEMRSIFIFNAGDISFDISDMSITSTTADVFKVPPITAPISVNAGEMKKIDIECNPTQEGLFTADLSISTNAETARRTILPAHYTLTCRSGTNNAPTDIMLSTQQIKSETSANTLIANISTLDADVNDPQTYTLQDASGLFVIKGNQLWTTRNIPIGSAGFDIKLKSTDLGGLFIEKDFHLTIVGNTLNQFKASVVTSEGVKTIVDETELITAKGYVQPLPEEVGKVGDVFVIYNYTSLTNGKAVLPITLLQNVPLQANIELPLYSGRLIYLSGKFEIVLGYRINGNENKGLATAFSVRRNAPPSGFELSRNTLVERSSAGTVIGKFVTQDTDKDDFFRYVITKNAGSPFGYFRVVGDELQMTESFPLTFKENLTLDIGVRVIDGAGGFFDKTFTIKVIENDVPHIGGEIRSNDYAIRGTKDQLATLVKDQIFTVNSWIQPPSIHLSKVADILYKIVFTPISGEMQIFEGIWEKDKTLTSAVDIEMAKDFSLDQIGTYEISIGYKLKDGSFRILTPFQKFRVQG